MEKGNAIYLPENAFCEYALVACPAPGVYGKVMAEKQLFFEEYKEKTAVSTKPYIVIAGFLAREAMEETFSRWIQRICNMQESFTVTLNNYSGFQPHTIYLRVQNAGPFQQLAKELKVVDEYIGSCSCPPMKFTARPHVSIAKQLSEAVYGKALTQYAHKTFHETFVVNELMLQKRKHCLDTCKSINVFGLQPQRSTVYNSF
ncbi:MAG: 2'-5' RNA ligase family protein [Chitinophagaceae bacterium]|nr:2'-5' RNA ligase family protein [Chitinophagaceae bacterium]